MIMIMMIKSYLPGRTRDYLALLAKKISLKKWNSVDHTKIPWRSLATKRSLREKTSIINEDSTREQLSHLIDKILLQSLVVFPNQRLAVLLESNEHTMTSWLNRVLKMKGQMFYTRLIKLRRKKKETNLRMNNLKSRDRKLMTLPALLMWR